MPNPYMPTWEYIPDGEPRVFGDRVYVYGSHDRPDSKEYCDYKLRAWSASVEDLSHWICHGDVFHTRDDDEHSSCVDWTENPLYAPDVIEKDGRYYLYFYILCANGGVAVSDSPTGPFELLHQYQRPAGTSEDFCEHGIFVDPGVLNDNGKIYIYCGFTRSYMTQINEDNMYEILPNTYQDDIIPVAEPHRFYEACSPRKVGDTYYLIYSPLKGSCLDYATSKSPCGPFEYRGTIVDNSIEYHGGNNHGSICNIKGQWYIFYHRNTNNTDYSRHACVEPIEILADGTIPQVEMTSMGFDKALYPYNKTAAEIACVLIGTSYITEEAPYLRKITANKKGSIVGFKYFDFGNDTTTKQYRFSMSVKRHGVGKIKIMLDDYNNGDLLGIIDIDTQLDENTWEWISQKVKAIEGRHALYFIFESDNDNDIADLGEFIFSVDNPN